MFKRILVSKLVNRLKETRRFIQIVVGPRQTGKTTAVLQALDELNTQTHFVSADDPTLVSVEWLRNEWQQARSLAKSGDDTDNPIDDGDDPDDDVDVDPDYPYDELIGDYSLCQPHRRLLAHSLHCSGFAYMQVKVSNLCGSSGWVDIRYELVSCEGVNLPGIPPPSTLPCGCECECECVQDHNEEEQEDPIDGDDDPEDEEDPISFTYFPNPVSGELTLEFTNLPSRGEQSTAFSVRLLDNRGITLTQRQFRHHRKNSKPQPVKINVSSLRDGTYYLHVEGGGKIRKEQIIIKR